MSSITKDLKLGENEELKAELQGNLKVDVFRIPLLETIISLIKFILGFRISGHIILTNSRIIVAEKRRILYFFTSGISLTSILPQAVNSIGYAQEGKFLGCLCSDYYIELSLSGGTTYAMTLTNANKNELLKYINMMYDAICN